MHDLFSLEGKTALVTGASRGLGQAIALALAEAGADVVCASSREGGTAETAQGCRALGRAAHEVHADLTDPAAVWHMLGEVDAFGEIDVLVNNAGTIRRHPAHEYPDDAWREVVETNLNAVFAISRHVGRGMIERGGGKIINVASLLSFQGGVTVPAYTASKHAVAGLTKALANEWAAHNVQVNALAPGYFRTDNTRALQDDPARRSRSSRGSRRGGGGRPGTSPGRRCSWPPARATT
jgi:2-dehydro-3-deoxy-D-gluconate 5-dehydrogenase